MSLGTILLFIVVLALIATMHGRAAHARVGLRPRQGAVEVLIILVVLVLLGLL